MKKRGARHDAYQGIARVYNALGHFYSGGQIEACKAAFLDEVNPGDRVLFVGAGSGDDVITAVRLGARVTAIDMSGAMLERLRTRLAAANAVASEIVCADVRAIDRTGRYDWVIANFFLNVFPARELHEMTAHLASFLAQDGRLIVGDFAAPVARWGERSVQQLHYYVPLVVFWLTTGTSLHRLHDYRAPLAAAGLTVYRTRHFQAFGWGPRWYSAVLAKRSA